MASPGDFTYLPVLNKSILKDMYDTITQLDLWNSLDSPKLIEKYKNFPECMKVMKRIHDNGWKWYVTQNTCYCRRQRGLIGWCGIAGGGVPACDH